MTAHGTSDRSGLCDRTNAILGELACLRWHGSGYGAAGSIHPTAAGWMASAKRIWDAMVANCIAQ